jgi:hypothetical protein
MTREQLIASLTATDNRDYQLDEDRYFDWSTKTEDGVSMEISDGTDTVQVDMTRSEIQALQQRLTAWLLRDAE